MKLDDLDRELARLRDASERVAANLVELEIDSSRQLLEASTLSGESAKQWSAASAALTDLWQWREQLEGVLERAHELRRGRRADELHGLLTGPSIELTRSEVPLAERDLLGSPERAVRCTPDELLARMSRAFDQVKTVVARFGEAWETLTPRVTDARTGLDRARTLAATVGESGRPDLEAGARHALAIGERLSTDPVSVSAGEVDRLIESLQAIERDLEATAAFRRDLDFRLADARNRLTRLAAVREECRVAHQELLVKIAAPSAPAPPADAKDLAGELDQIASLAGSGAWREAARRLDALTERLAKDLDDCESALRANRAPLDARNQLRALLEAYQVKAGRLGAIEDPAVERIFAQAHDALYTAPTDLAAAAQLVRRYQERLNTAQEVLR
ncbi:MAG: hypothetical protein ACTHMY_08385 [Solirubrobacteraceae bacterium]